MDTVKLNLALPNGTLDFNNQSSFQDYDYETSITAYYKRVKILQKISISFFSIIFVLGIIGNGLVIWIAGFRMKKTISAVWFLNLAMADFLCCASLPLRIVEWLTHFAPPDLTLCKWSMFLFNLNMSASVFTLTAMSIDRWVSVMWPFWAKVHRTRKVVRITVAIIWVFSLILTGLVFMVYVGRLRSYSEWCSFGPWFKRVHIDRTIQMFQIIRLLIMFVIPFLIISISYVFIFLKLRKSKRPQRSQRPYRIITAVILCFFICWFPYYIWRLTPLYYGDYIQFHRVNTIFANLAYLNSCINPIIYVFMGQDFKHSFLRSIPFRLEKALSEHPDNQCEEPRYLEPAHITQV